MSLLSIDMKTKVVQRVTRININKDILLLFYFQLDILNISSPLGVGQWRCENDRDPEHQQVHGHWPTSATSSHHGPGPEECPVSSLLYYVFVLLLLYSIMCPVLTVIVISTVDVSVETYAVFFNIKALSKYIACFYRILECSEIDWSGRLFLRRSRKIILAGNQLYDALVFVNVVQSSAIEHHFNGFPN